MSDSDDKNVRVAEALREAFAPLVEQLTPEVEPATVFTPSLEDNKDE
ncbi:MAG TPA: hypothetical protein VH601_17090 [Bryobacteraceae bacterium]|jgi:hypothetical protein